MRVLGLLIILWQTQGWSAPLMETGVGTQAPILATVLSDHEVPHLYYVFPQGSEVTATANGKQDFLYLENRTYRRHTYKVNSAELRVGLKISLTSPELDAKVKEIRARDSAARFAVITAFKTEVAESEESGRFFESARCTSIAGPLEVPVYCSVSIYPHLSYGFRQIIQRTQTRVFHYIYHFYGMGNGTLKEYAFSVPLKVGSLESGYFLDQFGSILSDESNLR